MSNLKEEICEYLRVSPGMTDREITNALRGANFAQQPINQACRQMAEKGELTRSNRNDGLIGNYLSTTASMKQGAQSRKVSRAGDQHASEDDVKKILVKWLERNGWTVVTAWGQAPGADCVAERAHERWIIEVKGQGSRQAMRVNYFLAVLGELLQRMDDPNAHYSVAFPDVEQFEGLWRRLPSLAKERTTISAIFVTKEGQVRVAE
jgi:hypothetical protein